LEKVIANNLQLELIFALEHFCPIFTNFMLDEGRKDLQGSYLRAMGNLGR